MFYSLFYLYKRKHDYILPISFILTSFIPVNVFDQRFPPFLNCLCFCLCLCLCLPSVPSAFCERCSDGDGGFRCTLLPPRHPFGSVTHACFVPMPTDLQLWICCYSQCGYVCELFLCVSLLKRSVFLLSHLLIMFRPSFLMNCIELAVDVPFSGSLQVLPILFRNVGSRILCE